MRQALFGRFQALHQFQFRVFQFVNGRFRLFHLLNALLVFLILAGIGLEGLHLADVGTLVFNRSLHVPYILFKAGNLLLGVQGLLLDGLHLPEKARSLFRQGGQFLAEPGNARILSCRISSWSKSA